MKICFKCLKNKRIESFYKHKQMKDGYLNKCKTCAKEDAKKHILNNLRYIKEYDRLRANLPHRVKARKAYRKTDACKLSCAKANKKWIKNNPEKRAAHIILNNRLHSGEIKKMSCKLCGSPNSQAHHKDYSRPLDVIWLCALCHSFKHKINKYQ